MRFILILLLSLGVARVGAQTYQERAVAAVLMGEAWSEGAQGMTAVVEVIHRRSVLKDKTLLAIIAERNRKSGIWAFSCLNGVGIDRLIQKFQKEPDFTEALRIAQIATRTPNKLPGMTKGATHFTLARERPYWARGHRPVAVLGSHAFYRLP